MWQMWRWKVTHSLFNFKKMEPKQCSHSRICPLITWNVQAFKILLWIRTAYCCLMFDWNFLEKKLMESRTDPIIRKYLESLLPFCLLLLFISCYEYPNPCETIRLLKTKCPNIFFAFPQLFVFLINSTVWNKLLTYQTFLFSVTASAVNRLLTIHNERTCLFFPCANLVPH